MEQELFLPTLMHWQYGNNWCGSLKRASFWIRRDNGTRPAQRPGRERRSIADMETSLSWVLNVAHKKRQGDAPLLSEQPGPHGHPDVTLPICNHIQKRMHWWQDTKKAVIVRQLGTGKRLRLRLAKLGNVE